MSDKPTSGWIAGRSQITFLVGLVIAAGVIFWLEKVRFETSDDPLGSFWIEQREPPAPRVLDAGARTLIEQWRPELVAKIVAADPALDPVPVLLGYASCLKALDPCAARLTQPAREAIQEVATGVRWEDPLLPSLTLVALASLQRDRGAPDPRAAWRTVALWLDGFDDWALGGRFGTAQFVSRAAALTGNEYASFRSYASLREVLEAADGLTRLGTARTAELARGLGLLTVMFPRTPLAKVLLWQVCTAWPGDLAESPIPVAVLCWSNFAAPELNRPLSARLVDPDLQSLSPLDAAIVLLTLTALEQGPLLEGR